MSSLRRLWQKKGSSRLEEKERQILWDVFSVLIETIASHEVKWSDFATSILKKLILKITWRAARKKTTLKRSFYPSVFPFTGERHSSAPPLWQLCTINAMGRIAYYGHEKQREESAELRSHPGTFWRMHAHFWAMDCLPAKCLDLESSVKQGPWG